MKKLLVAVCFIAACLAGFAQDARTYFDHYDILSGLPEALVRTVNQDDQGYIWLGTQGGIVRFDGYRYKVYNLGTESKNTVSVTNTYTVYIDQFKNLWVSSVKNGLFKYNRSTDSFEQFVFPDKRYTVITIKTADQQGNIWGTFLTNKGEELLTRFDIKSKRFENFGPKETGRHRINATVYYYVIRATDNNLWAATNNGVYRYDEKKGSFKSYLASADTAKWRGVNPFYEDPSQPGLFWMNTFHGNNLDLRIESWDSNTGAIKQYKTNPDKYDPNTEAVYYIHEDKKKQLWFASDSGLLKLDRKTGKFSLYVQQDTFLHGKKNPITYIRENKAGNFWLNTDYGLARFDAVLNRFDSFLPDASRPGAISGSAIINTLIDNNDVLWAGTAYQGASRVNNIKSAFTIYKNDKSKLGGYPSGQMFVVNTTKTSAQLNDAHNIYQWHPGAQEFNKIYQLPKDEFISAAIKGKDSIWYLGTSKGLLVYDLVKKTSVRYHNIPGDTTSLASNQIHLLLQDYQGALWIGTGDAGMCSFNVVSKKFKRYPFRLHGDELTTAATNGMLDDPNVQAIYEDHQHNLWVGTNWGGLNRFDTKTGKFYSYHTQQNKPVFCVDRIFEDHLGRFWVCTYQEGLFLFDRQKGVYSKQFNETNGLLFNAANDIKEDVHGNLWVLSQRGLSKINGETFTIKNFKMGDMLPGYEIPHFTDLTKLGDGSFVIGLKNGMAVFDLKALDDNPYPPVVHIEHLIFSNPRSNEKEAIDTLAFGHKTINIHYNQNRIQFNYVALHFDNPAENKFAYKLDNYDKQWVQAGYARSVTYTNLSPGIYTFHVIAANSSGVWNNTGDSITVIIDSPWWVRWWAWLLYLVVFAWALYAFIVYRSRTLKRENLLLEEKVNIRTQQLHEQQEEITAQRDQLSDANRELSEQQEEITTQRDQLSESLSRLTTTQRQLIQSEKLASLGELTAGIAHEIQNPLNFVNNFSDVSAELIGELEEELVKGDVAEARMIAGDVKQNLEKIRHHGHRADSIVKSMLEHSRAGTRDKELSDINKIADEFLRLSYHGLRAKDKTFNSEMVTGYQPDLPAINVVAQDIGRVLLNIFNNAFYAVHKRKIEEGEGYKPEVKVNTTVNGNWVIITVTDNGTGIAKANLEKIMQPFFTTKPTGEGTGLGLSLSYDIVVKGHGGDILIDSKEGAFTIFTVKLPVG